MQPLRQRYMYLCLAVGLALGLELVQELVQELVKELVLEFLHQCNHTPLVCRSRRMCCPLMGKRYHRSSTDFLRRIHQMSMQHHRQRNMNQRTQALGSAKGLALVGSGMGSASAMGSVLVGLAMGSALEGLEMGLAMAKEFRHNTMLETHCLPHELMFHLQVG